MDWLTYVVTTEDEGLTVEQVVREKMSVSGRMLQRLTRSKGIRHNGRPPRLARKVKPGDRVSVRIGERPAAAAKAPDTAAVDAPDLDGAFLYEDNLFVVVNKPAGMLVHPVRPGQTGTLQDALAAHFQRNGENAAPHPVHRLDRETSGALLAAKNSYAHQLADRELREGRIHREYLAILCGRLTPDRGTINRPIARDPGHRLKRRVSEDGEEAVTHYQALARDDQTTLVRVRLETGRTHQIRVHFSHIGHPLAGDPLYGGRPLGWQRHALHAIRLSFPHPLTRERVDVTAPLPDDLAAEVRRRYGLSPEALAERQPTE